MSETFGVRYGYQIVRPSMLVTFIPPPPPTLWERLSIWVFRAALLLGAIAVLIAGTLGIVLVAGHQGGSIRLVFGLLVGMATYAAWR